ncbi:hypothetical protein SMAC4_07449 [Sordaria macrospora]|uniref:Small ribosomal subunit protein mS37 n=1 Tax=Sordaria macrospora (strain ATCC MYA-333 / DSM 997 / K(L3346) / K-hell) TaxID=771870 RepID=F7VM12_SORMK|nr:mitochondrial 37S ribosomal protein YmS-T [Sordaria macrospora k-hell]KAH7628317.1 hypothetical protein B0T09DRAFT_268453 [Sordaria sp. MPI-SDFR-AT-0083]WPJ65763.1 hypothetical protein SMAC4_07449 [Sordaria macrospora]CCC06540.1 unnamed protein product [Sordaria macrospora k-hell]
MVHKPIRLPPLKKLKVRQPNKAEENPCIAVMSSVLACWASAGYNSAGCATVENALRACMDTPKPAPKASNTINYHLQRFHERLTQGKRKK